MTLERKLRELDWLVRGLPAQLEVSYDVEASEYVAMLIPKDGRAYSGRGSTSADALAALHATLETLTGV